MLKGLNCLDIHGTNNQKVCVIFLTQFDMLFVNLLNSGPLDLLPETLP